MIGTLYLVATPIGNLEDITLRALRVLKEVDIIACEDTRRTIKLCNYYDIKTRLVSYHEHNEYQKSESLIALLLEGKSIALVSDAGTPAISDPGEIIVKEAIAKNIDIRPIPGPSALVAALIASGLNTRSFAFYGFLSKKRKERIEEIEVIKNQTGTVILYVSPHSYKLTINELSQILGNRKIVIAREITKIHESYLRGYLNDAEVLDYEPRGEICLVIEGKEEELKITDNPLCQVSLTEHFEFYIRQDMTRNKAMRCVAKDRDLSKNEVYENLLKEKRGLESL